MKFLFTLLLIIGVFDRIEGQMNHETISEIIDELRINYAPDKRTSVFNINFLISDKNLELTGETNLPEVKNKLIAAFQKFNVVDKIVLLPSEKLGKNIFGIVNVSVANIRTKPEHSAELASQILLGSRLRILKSSGEWYLVQCEDEYIGWLDDDGVKLMDENEYNNWNESEKVIITNPFTFVFSEPDITSNSVSDVIEGNLLKVISINNDFTQIEFPDGRIGFVSNDQSSYYNTWLNSREQSFSAIKQTAFRMMGIPYVWGGTSIKGLDCSGFTKLVFQLNGILLPRDASQQVHVGEAIDTQNGFGNLREGDLLFFGRTDSVSKRQKITHVAIYLGNLDFIHASGRVRINSFNPSKEDFAEDRLKTFITAKRILTSIGINEVKLLKNFRFK